MNQGRGTVSDELSPDEIKTQYRKVFRLALLNTAIFVGIGSCALYTGISGRKTLIGLTGGRWMGLTGLCGAAYLAWINTVWKCPVCGSFPGGGWFARRCTACGAVLR